MDERFVVAVSQHPSSNLINGTGAVERATLLLEFHCARLQLKAGPGDPFSAVAKLDPLLGNSNWLMTVATKSIPPLAPRQRVDTASETRTFHTMDERLN